MKKHVLICDECGAENWNLASCGKSHSQPANEVKGMKACAGIWRLPVVPPDRAGRGVVFQFPTAPRRADECPCGCHDEGGPALACGDCAEQHGPRADD